MRSPLNPEFVVESYLHAERDLIAALEFVPYENGHRDVWSPPFASLLLDTCSQLDSLWKAMALESPLMTRRPDEINIKRYHEWFGHELSPCQAAFMRGISACWIRPFAGWSAKADYRPLDWWSAYTSIKHDRWGNVRVATLARCVQAAAGLFIAICNSDPCKPAVESLLTISASPEISHNPKAWLGRLSEQPNFYVAVESDVFVYPAGWGSDTVIKPTDEWRGSASVRFKSFFDSYSD